MIKIFASFAEEILIFFVKLQASVGVKEEKEKEGKIKNKKAPY